MLIRTFIPMLLLLWLASCSGNTGQLVADLDRYIMSCDSTTNTLEKEITPQTIVDLMAQSARLKAESQNHWNQSDTLDLETAIKLDAFQAAYSNAILLEQEHKMCLQEATIQRKRITLLKEDIDHGRGDRSDYARKVADEKKELTKIRRHCNDIRIRFEELENSLSEMSSILDTATRQP